MKIPQIEKSYTPFFIAWSVSIVLAFSIGVITGRSWGLSIQHDNPSTDARKQTLIDLVLNVPGAGCRETDRHITTEGGRVSYGHLNENGATEEPKSEQFVKEKITLECTRTLGTVLLEGGRKPEGVKW